jgi:glucoamylase
MAAAPGAPGLDPTWSSSNKEMVGCSLGSSRLWFTIGGGIINEVYYPRVDLPQIRDLGFIVADGAGFWVEVKRMWRHVLTLGAPGVPAVHIVHRHPRFELALRVVCGEDRDVLHIETQLDGDPRLRLYALLAPHLGGTGRDNRAEVVQYRGRKVLWAEQGPFGLALAAMTQQQLDAFGRASAGISGVSDGWQDFSQHGAMTWEYDSAGPGNVALMGELPRHALLGLGFGSSAESAATLALAALFEPFERHWERQIATWTQWQVNREAESISKPANLPDACAEQFDISCMVVRAHRDKTYPGAMVASLSVPWGNTHEEREGYHLVWPRDMVECAGALAAGGAHYEARNTLRYLIATQNADGHWYQNQWLGGKGYWMGIQLDEAAFPVLLAALLDEHEALDGTEIADMVRRALGFVVRTGPVSAQDRWEEDAGLNTFTLAVCIAALVAGAPCLPQEGRELALAFADYWNARLEDWTTVSDTPLARRFGVAGYYVREAPPEALQNRSATNAVIAIKNRSHDPALPAAQQVGVDFLQLVRFGLRRADDPMVLATLKIADALLKVDTPAGPCWHRYNGDGYGEHDDGRPFDGTGRGRAWPLLTGERGHYEIVAGRDPLPLIVAMTRMASPGGMLPEQIWDAAPLPARGLFPGRPTGSAMPLAWTHAEYLKLVNSRDLKRPVDRPAAVWERYHGERPALTRVMWCEHAPATELPEGCALTVALFEAGTVHWGVDGWQQVRDQDTSASCLGLHVVALDTTHLRSGDQIDLTFRYGERWVGRDYLIRVTPAAADAVR